MPPKFRQNHDCTLQVSLVHRCQVSTYATKHPEVSQCAKLQGFGLFKTTLQVSTCPTKHPEVSQYAKIQGFGRPKTTLQVSTCPIKPPKFHNTLKSKVSDYLKRPSKFLSTHEVREFLTIPHPNAPDQTPTPHPPKPFGVSDSLQNPYLSRENFTPWGLDRPPPAPPRTSGNPSVCVPKNA